MDQELIAYLDKRFGETTQQIQGLREEMVQRMDEGVRHLGVSLEGARDDIRGIAEGVMCMDERLGSFRKEVEQELEDIRKLIQPVYSTFDQRLRTLEMRKDFQGRDPVEMVRERFGLKRPDKPSE